jgi:hypothetical protein
VPGCKAGGSGDKSHYDYCYKEDLLATYGVNPPGYRKPLEACQGDCDSDRDCKPGLKCFFRGERGISRTVDVAGCTGGGSHDKPGWDYCYQPLFYHPVSAADAASRSTGHGMEEITQKNLSLALDPEKIWQIVKVQEVCSKYRDKCVSQEVPTALFQWLPEQVVNAYLAMDTSRIPRNGHIIDLQSMTLGLDRMRTTLVDGKMEINYNYINDIVSRIGAPNGIVRSPVLTPNVHSIANAMHGMGVGSSSLVQAGCDTVNQCLNNAITTGSCASGSGNARRLARCCIPSDVRACQAAIDACKDPTADPGNVCWRQALCCQPNICNSWKEQGHCPGAFCATALRHMSVTGALEESSAVKATAYDTANGSQDAQGLLSRRGAIERSTDAVDGLDMIGGKCSA